MVGREAEALTRLDTIKKAPKEPVELPVVSFDRMLPEKQRELLALVRKYKERF
jgi:hypothetical protein